MPTRPFEGTFALTLALAGFSLFPILSTFPPEESRQDQAIGEPVSFVNGSTHLSGSLLSPAGPGPYPTFVAIQGSGGASYRDSWSPEYFPFWKDVAEFLVDRGYAVLLFDKPGVNHSTGDWRRQTFDDRAEEVLAAVRHLADRDDIDASRIGLVGHSQGGWIAQIAGARSPDEVGFLLLLAGPAISVKRQIQDDLESGWVCRGISGMGLSVRRAGLRFALGILDLVARVARPGYLSRIIHFDPRHVLPEIGQPTLALFAENDPLVLLANNQVRLARHFGTANGNDRLEVATVLGADHFFRSSPLCPGSQRPREWAPGFFEDLAAPEYWNWIEGDGG